MDESIEPQRASSSPIFDTEPSGSKCSSSTEGESPLTQREHLEPENQKRVVQFCPTEPGRDLAIGLSFSAEGIGHHNTVFSGYRTPPKSTSSESSNSEIRQAGARDDTDGNSVSAFINVPKAKRTLSDDIDIQETELERGSVGRTVSCGNDDPKDNYGLQSVWKVVSVLYEKQEVYERDNKNTHRDLMHINASITDFSVKRNKMSASLEALLKNFNAYKEKNTKVQKELQVSFRELGQSINKLTTRLTRLEERGKSKQGSKYSNSKRK